MKTNSLSYIFIIALLLIFSSCAKEQVEFATDLPVKNEMLVFNSMEDLNAAINKTVSLNHDELKAYEESIGFKSFGRKCEEVYYSIDIDLFNSSEEIKEYVEKHSEYLVLIKDENEEYTLEHYLYNNPARYIINKNKMYQFGENVFKVFQKHYAYTNRANIDELIHLDEKDLISNKVDSKITIVHTIPTIEIKDAANNCGSGEFEKNRYSTSGKQRIKLYIVAHQPPAGAGGWSYARAYFLAKPYERTLGIWFGTSERTITADIRLALDYMTPNGWNRIMFMQYFAPRKARQIEGEIGDWVYYGTTDYPLNVHFGSFDCWATSGPVTDENGDLRYAILKCGNLF